MHTVELLDETLGLASRLGYAVRHEWLGGNGGDACEIKGRKWIFLDLAQSPIDQLNQVLETLRRHPDALNHPMHHQLRELLAYQPPGPSRATRKTA